MISNRIVLIAAASLAATQLRAQDACVGPGAAIGVTGYQCASCGFRRENGVSSWEFNAEPVITQVAPWSVLKPGDVVQAVNGIPITTAEAARVFSDPIAAAAASRSSEALIIVDGTPQSRPYQVTVRLRRGGESATFTATALAQCNQPVNWEVRGGGGRGGRGTLGLTGFRLQLDSASGPDSLRNVRIRGMLQEATYILGRTVNRTGRFGFALSCVPSCTKATAQDGTEFWKYDGFPTIAEVRAGSPAANAGLVVGDVVTAIEGTSIVTDDGALTFLKNAKANPTLHVTVKRNGQDVGFQLTAPVGGARGGGRGRGVPPPN